MAQSSAFREYLESSGGEEAMWKVLIKLDGMKNKPEDPVEFIRENIAPELSEIYKTLKEDITKTEEELLAIAEKYPKIYEKYMKRKKKSVGKPKKKK